MDTKVILDAIPEIIDQLLAFLIVFWILKKFAFGTVAKVLDQRRDTIAQSMKAAEEERARMEALKRDYESRLLAAGDEARRKVQEAVHDAQRISAEIRQRAHEDALAETLRARGEIARETERARAALRSEIIGLSVQVAARLIEKNMTDGDNLRLAEKALDEAEERAR